MKKLLILSIAVLSCLSLSTYAQDDGGGYGSSAGDITFSILLGRGNYLNYGSVPSAPGSSYNWTVYGQAPYANVVDANDNYIGNIVGGEARYFITSRIAVNLSGGAILRNTPAKQNIQYFYLDVEDGYVGDLEQGNDPATSNQGWIPHYGSVEADNRFETNGNLGVEYHFPSSRFNRLSPYAGLNFNYYYSRRSVYNPSIYYQTNYYVAGTGETDVLIYDIGIRSAVTQGMGAQLVAGIDVYLLPGVYLGVVTRPASYLYTWNDKIPAPGLESLQAESHTLSFFAQTFFKVGFIIGSL